MLISSVETIGRFPKIKQVCSLMPACCGVCNFRYNIAPHNPCSAAGFVTSGIIMRLITPCITLCILPLHIMLRDLLTQKCSHFYKVTDFEYHRACRFRKYQIENRLPSLVLPTFFKTWLLLRKMWLKLAIIDRNGIFRFFLKISFFECNRSKTVSVCSTTWKTWKMTKKRF
jgi:hypothetical protein